MLNISSQNIIFHVHALCALPCSSFVAWAWPMHRNRPLGEYIWLSTLCWWYTIDDYSGWAAMVLSVDSRGVSYSHTYLLLSVTPVARPCKPYARVPVASEPMINAWRGATVLSVNRFVSPRCCRHGNDVNHEYRLHSSLLLILLPLPLL